MRNQLTKVFVAGSVIMISLQIIRTIIHTFSKPDEKVQSNLLSERRRLTQLKKIEEDLPVDDSDNDLVPRLGF